MSRNCIETKDYNPNIDGEIISVTAFSNAGIMENAVLSANYKNHIVCSCFISNEYFVEEKFYFNVLIVYI